MTKTEQERLARWLHQRRLPYSDALSLADVIRDLDKKFKSEPWLALYKQSEFAATGTRAKRVIVVQPAKRKRQSQGKNYVTVHSPVDGVKVRKLVEKPRVTTKSAKTAEDLGL